MHGRRRHRERERSLRSERALLEAGARAESVELLLLDERWADEIRTALASLAAGLTLSFTVIGLSSDSSTALYRENTPIPGPMADCGMSAGAMLAA